jgi:hypothetical protein
MWCVAVCAGIAISQPHAGNISLLLRAGADPTLRNSDGVAPLGNPSPPARKCGGVSVCTDRPHQSQGAVPASSSPTGLASTGLA